MFSREIIKNCINLDSALAIPWLRFVRDKFQEIGLGYFYDNPGTIPMNPKAIIKAVYHTRAIMRYPQHKEMGFTHLLPVPQQFCLTFTTNAQTRFILTRIRLCTVHF